jgi:hypothetical protein
MDAYPAEDHLSLQCPERLALKLARGRAVDRVGGPRSETLELEFFDASPDLLVAREADALRPVLELGS